MFCESTLQYFLLHGIDAAIVSVLSPKTFKIFLKNHIISCGSLEFRPLVMMATILNLICLSGSDLSLATAV